MVICRCEDQWAKAEEVTLAKNHASSVLNQLFKQTAGCQCQVLKSYVLTGPFICLLMAKALYLSSTEQQ